MLKTWNNLNSVRKAFERFEAVFHQSILKFPKFTESDLRNIDLGSYQLSQTESYYAEQVNEDGKYVSDGYKYRDSLHLLRQSIFKALDRC